MRKLLLTATFLLVASVSYGQTNPNVSCNTAGTDCTVKKNGSFVLTTDPYSDPNANKYRLYVDGAKAQEVTSLVNGAIQFTMSSSAIGDHTLYVEAVGTCNDTQGVPQECATASVNTVVIHTVNGNPTAPKNLRIIK